MTGESYIRADEQRAFQQRPGGEVRARFFDRKVSAIHSVPDFQHVHVIVAIEIGLRRDKGRLVDDRCDGRPVRFDITVDLKDV